MGPLDFRRPSSFCCELHLRAAIWEGQEVCPRKPRFRFLFGRLVDNRHYFPPYDAAPVARAETLLRLPAVRAALEHLAGRITAEDMQAMNNAVDTHHEDVGDIARRFLDAHRAPVR